MRVWGVPMQCAYIYGQGKCAGAGQMRGHVRIAFGGEGVVRTLGTQLAITDLETGTTSEEED